MSDERKETAFRNKGQLMPGPQKGTGMEDSVAEEKVSKERVMSFGNPRVWNWFIFCVMSGF